MKDLDNRAIYRFRRVAAFYLNVLSFSRLVERSNAVPADWHARICSRSDCILQVSPEGWRLDEAHNAIVLPTLVLALQSVGRGR